MSSPWAACIIIKGAWALRALVPGRNALVGVASLRNDFIQNN